MSTTIYTYISVHVSYNTCQRQFTRTCTLVCISLTCIHVHMYTNVHVVEPKAANCPFVQKYLPILANAQRHANCPQHYANCP